MQITGDRTLFSMDLNQLKEQPIWSVRRSSAEFAMGNSIYLLGSVSFRETDADEWSHYYVSTNETLFGTNLPRWYPLDAASLYDNTLIDNVTYAQAEEVIKPQI